MYNRAACLSLFDDKVREPVVFFIGFARRGEAFFYPGRWLSLTHRSSMIAISAVESMK